MAKKDISVQRRKDLAVGESSFLKKLWETYKPRAFYEVVLMGNPGVYILWKIPEETHRKVNYLLDSITPLAASSGRGDVALGVLLADGVSHVMYGLKTIQNKDSGKHVVGGLSKIADSLEKMNIKDKEKILRSIDDIVKNDFEIVTSDSSSKSGPVVQS